MIVLSQTLKKLAYRLILAYSYTPEAIKDFLKLFKSSLNNENNFEKESKHPLTFTDKYLTHFNSELKQLSTKYEIHRNLAELLTSGLEKGEATLPYIIAQFFSSVATLKQALEVDLGWKLKEKERPLLESLKRKLKKFLDEPYTNLRMTHIENLIKGSKNFEEAKNKISPYIDHLIDIFKIELTPEEIQVMKAI